jgi:hypothetical protein
VGNKVTDEMAGTGSAIITDITVELLPNLDIIQEICPDSDDGKSEDDISNDEAMPIALRRTVRLWTLSERSQLSRAAIKSEPKTPPPPLKAV